VSILLRPGYYCEHGGYLLASGRTRCGCTVGDALPLCFDCEHEPHSPHACVVLVEDDDGRLSECACALDSYAAKEAS